MTDPKHLESIGFAEKLDAARAEEYYKLALHFGMPDYRQSAELERAVISAAIAYRNEAARKFAPQYFEYLKGELSANLIDAVDNLLKARER